MPWRGSTCWLELGTLEMTHRQALEEVYEKTGLKAGSGSPFLMKIIPNNCSTQDPKYMRDVKKRKIIFYQLFSSSCLSCPMFTILISHNLYWWSLLRSVPAKVFLQKALRKVDFEKNFSSTAQGAPIPASNIGIVFYLSVIFNWEKLFAFWMFESSVILKWERLIALRLTPVFLWSVKN